MTHSVGARPVTVRHWKRLRLIQYYGGKGKLVTKLRSLIPPGGRPYCEPFAGAAAVLINRDPAPVEVLNDIDGEIVNLFRVIQDQTLFPLLSHRLQWTPYSRDEYARALDTRKRDDASAVDRAWATYVAFNQALSGQPTSAGSWSRSLTKSQRGMASSCSRWQTGLFNLGKIHERLMRVQIDNRDAIEVIRYWDGPDAVFYCDPPYVHATRRRKAYKHECDDEFHRILVRTLLECRGACVLSGYRHEIYRPLEEAGWEAHEFQTACHAAGKVRGSSLLGPGAALANAPRTEVVWRNQRAVEMCGGQGRLPLVEEHVEAICGS